MIICKACNQPIKANSLDDIAIVDNQVIHHDCLILPSVISCCLCANRHFKTNYKVYSQIKAYHLFRHNDIYYYICTDCLNQLNATIEYCRYCNHQFINFPKENLQRSIIPHKLCSLDIKIGHNNVCEYCYSRHICCIDGCRELSVDEENYCSKHLAIKSINNYSYKPEQIFYLSDFTKKLNEKNPIYIGVELEVNFNSEDDMCKFINTMRKDDFFYFKQDGSLKKYGVEIVSHPADLHYHLNRHWKKLFDEMNKYKTDIENCGLHFHFSKNAFNNNEIVSIDYIVNGFKQIINDIGGRNYNTYAQRYVGWEWGDSRPHKHYDVCNLSNPNTIELRFCKSTTNYKTFIKRLKSIFALIAFCKSIDNIVEFLDDHIKQAQASKNKDFIQLVTNKFNQFKCNFLSTI